MKNMEIIKQINIIVCEILNDNNIVLTSETTAKDVEGWDSLNNIQIITAIEKHFKLKFNLNEILELNTIADICKLIVNK
jgi:acyl carrier protein